MMVPDRREGAAGAQVDDAIDILLSLASAPDDREATGGRAVRPAPASPGPPVPRAKPRPLRPVEHPPPARRKRSAGRAGRWTALTGLVAVLAIIPDLGIRPPLALIAPARSSLDTLLRGASTFGQAAISLGGQIMAAVPGRGEAAASAAPGPPAAADLVVAAAAPKPGRPAWKDPVPTAEIPRPAAEAIAAPAADPPAHAVPAADEEPLQGVPAGVVDHGDPLDPPVDPATAVEPPGAPEEVTLQDASGDAPIEEARAPEPADERWMEPLVQALVARPPAEAPPVEAAPVEITPAPPAPVEFPPASSPLQPAAAAADEVAAALTEALAKEREAILDRERERSETLAREIAGLRSELENLRARSLELAQAAPAQASPGLEPAEAAPPAQADPVPPAQTVQTRAAPPEPAPVQTAPAQAAPAQAAPQPAPGQTPPASAGRLVARAEALIKSHDISGARLLLERAMAEGSAQAAFLLAQTYDPRALASWGVVGIRPDPGRADQLYARAQAGGVREAGERLSRR
jgi:hypothetical protein